MTIRLTVFVICAFFISCSSPYFKALEGIGSCPVMLEARKQEGFELRFINLSGKGLRNLSLTFDNKYKHSIYGLYSVEKGLLKDSVFKAGDTLTFQFTKEIDNAIYFNVEEREFVPAEILINNNECSTTWHFK